MTFGSTFGRVFSPTFQPKSQAAGGWWNLNGTITSCVAAYQPKGAADYAASKVNLANPGTYNAVDGAAYPTWDATNGWVFAGASSQRLTTDIVNVDGKYSVIVRFSNIPEASVLAPLFGAYTGAGRDSEIMPRYNTDKIWYVNGSNWLTITPAAGITSGVLAIAGVKAYRDGVAETGTSQAWSGVGTRPYFIGCLNNNGTAQRFITGYIQALSFYDAVLTPEQVIAISAAMAAL